MEDKDFIDILEHWICRNAENSLHQSSLRAPAFTGASFA